MAKQAGKVESDKAEKGTGNAGPNRKPQIAKAPAKNFDERTGAGTPPWQKEDGSQDTGVEDQE